MMNENELCTHRANRAFPFPPLPSSSCYWLSRICLLSNCHANGRAVVAQNTHAQLSRAAGPTRGVPGVRRNWIVSSNRRKKNAQRANSNVIGNPAKRNAVIDFNSILRLRDLCRERDLLPAIADFIISSKTIFDNNVHVYNCTRVSTYRSDISYWHFLQNVYNCHAFFICLLVRWFDVAF